ncbi:CehA/McbA family metallohydrolase [Aerococcaceae bacterium WGS1372]
MRYQYPVEIHSHTIHSDGDFTVAQLVDAAIDFGYKGLILTDHNSSAGVLEMRELEAVLNKEIIALHGMEWTTYFGHMLAHDADYDVDWREATIDNIDVYMQEVQDANGLVGIAHPFDIGSPICTGCHWDYQVKDYNLVNYIELWNSNQPQEKSESILAYDFWLDKLQQGYEISCSAGRDWHRPDSLDANMGVTYLELKDEVLTVDNFKLALRQGQFYITLGPLVAFQLLTSASSQSYYMGDRVELRGVNYEGGLIKVSVQPTQLRDLKQFVIENAQLTVWNNEEVLFQSDRLSLLDESWDFEIPLTNDLAKGYLRFDIRADYRGVKDTPVVIGNPIYIK